MSTKWQISEGGGFAFCSGRHAGIPEVNFCYSRDLESFSLGCSFIYKSTSSPENGSVNYCLYVFADWVGQIEPACIAVSNTHTASLISILMSTIIFHIWRAFWLMCLVWRCVLSLQMCASRSFGLCLAPVGWRSWFWIMLDSKRENIILFWRQNKLSAPHLIIISRLSFGCIF